MGSCCVKWSWLAVIGFHLLTVLLAGAIFVYVLITSLVPTRSGQIVCDRMLYTAPCVGCLAVFISLACCAEASLGTLKKVKVSQCCPSRVHDYRAYPPGKIEKACLASYIAGLMLVLLGLISCTVFAFVVTGSDSGQNLTGRPGADKVYKLEQFSQWFRNRVDNITEWEIWIPCVSDCDNRTVAMTDACCKPPEECNFTRTTGSYREEERIISNSRVYRFRQNQTFGYLPPSSFPEGIRDCRVYKDVRDKQCFECDDCKAAFLGWVNGKMRMLASCCLPVILILVLVIGCACVVRSNIVDVTTPYSGISN